MEELYSKKVKCPVCNIDFLTSKVKASKLRVESRDTDLLTHYKGENPIKYYVFVCPECGYSAMEDKFMTIGYQGKEVIKEKVYKKWNKREYSGPRTLGEAIECYKLALLCANLIELRKFDLGNITLRIAWLFRLNNDKEEYRFLQLAVELFKEAYSKESISSEVMDEVTLSYLIGELSRRIGSNEGAVQWFSRTASNPFIKANPRIEKLTREQWHIAKEGSRRGVK